MCSKGTVLKLVVKKLKKNKDSRVSNKDSRTLQSISLCIFTRLHRTGDKLSDYFPLSLIKVRLESNLTFEDLVPIITISGTHKLCSRGQTVYRSSTTVYHLIMYFLRELSLPYDPGCHFK